MKGCAVPSFCTSSVVCSVRATETSIEEPVAGGHADLSNGHINSRSPHTSIACPGASACAASIPARGRVRVWCRVWAPEFPSRGVYGRRRRAWNTQRVRGRRAVVAWRADGKGRQSAGGVKISMCTERYSFAALPCRKSVRPQSRISRASPVKARVSSSSTWVRQPPVWRAPAGGGCRSALRRRMPARSAPAAAATRVLLPSCSLSSRLAWRGRRARGFDRWWQASDPVRSAAPGLGAPACTPGRPAPPHGCPGRPAGRCTLMTRGRSSGGRSAW